MERVRTPNVLGGRYVLEQEIGRRPPIAIWRAHDRVLERPVAVEILPGPPDGASARAFLGAVEAAAALSHPNIVSVFDLGTDGALAYAVTELIDGEPLAAVLARDGAVGHERAIDVALAVLAALEHVHVAGAVHGTLDPSRVLLGSDGRARLVDVGFGTIDPRRSAARPEDDVRAAGAILYAALTGRVPDPAPRPPSAVRPGVPRAVEEIVLRALAGRFADAAAFASALARLRATGGREAAVEAPNGTPAPTAPRGTGRSSAFRSWILVPLLLAVAVPAVLAAGYALGRLGVGPLRGEGPSEPTPATEPVPLEVAGASAFDPLGDRTESDDAAPNSIDGDRGTIWQTENYFDGVLNKPGVGLLLDLGETATVAGLRLATPSPGFRYEVRVGEDPEALAAGPSGPAHTSEADALVELDQPVEGRYVLVWITSVVDVGDANRAVVAELEVFGG